ncbi:MAG: glutamate formimidoyltransferase [Candidatus Krumholzibacteriota bacterium]|nr:glutamate formimidoyltransferase [Candidatus Krumholzibacteriota bacterium]
MKLVECVPNFSEGRDMARIDLITKEISGVDGVLLLDVDPGKDTNRTVVTMIGPPDEVVEAAFRAIKKASEVIDMATHSGAHARMGATDVCPFVPVSGVTMEECVELAHRLGKRVGDELGIPVYFYEYAASTPKRRNLADVRSGEYEGLPEKLKDPEWQPDCGPAKFLPGAGATAVSAREFLIAYNVNLNTRNTRVAKEIAFAIREKGRLKKDKNNKIVRDENGNSVRVPGIFKECKAVGWYMDDFGRAQVSINLTNYKITPPHLVFDECSRIAAEQGARVTGSELVGLIPLAAMVEAGKYYLKKMGRITGVPESELIHIASLSMGLGDLYPFEPGKKIIEYQFKRKDSLVAMPATEFCNLLSTDAPAPGGGSVAALCGALSGSLSAMVGALTHGKKGYEGAFEDMEEVSLLAQNLKNEFLADVDRDTDAFNRVMDAMRMKKKTDEEKAARAAMIEEMTIEATLVPFNVLKRTVEAAGLARVVCEKGNRNSVSDAGVAALAARTAAEGAYLNVVINLPGIVDERFKKDTLEEAKKLRAEAVKHTEETVRIAEKIIFDQG